MVCLRKQLKATLDLERGASSTVIESALKASARSLARQCSPEELAGWLRGVCPCVCPCGWVSRALKQPMRTIHGSKFRCWLRAGGKSLCSYTMFCRVLRNGRMGFSKRRRRVDTCHCCHVCGQSASKQLANTYTQAPRD